MDLVIDRGDRAWRISDEPRDGAGQVIVTAGGRLDLTRRAATTAVPEDVIHEAVGRMELPPGGTARVYVERVT